MSKYKPMGAYVAGDRDTCPACNVPYASDTASVTGRDAGTVAAWCANPRCPAKLRARVAQFHASGGWVR